jgi:hypothetical protein
MCTGDAGCVSYSNAVVSDSDSVPQTMHRLPGRYLHIMEPNAGEEPCHAYGKYSHCYLSGHMYVCTLLKRFQAVMTMVVSPSDKYTVLKLKTTVNQAIDTLKSIDSSFARPFLILCRLSGSCMLQ